MARDEGALLGPQSQAATGGGHRCHRQAGLCSFEPLEGNLAQQWSAQVAAGRSPREVLQKAIVDLTEIDRRYDPECPASVSTRA